MNLKTKSLTGLISLTLTSSLIGIYACSTTTTTTKPGAKTNVADNSELPDRGLGNTKPDKRNKKVILKEAVNRKLKSPIVDAEAGVTMSDYIFKIGTDDNKDGGENESANGNIEITGLGKHKIKIELENYPIMDNKDDVQVITDETTGNTRVYTADQDLQRYSISDGKTKLLIETNPDGSWNVDGKPAKTAAEVVKLALLSPVFSDASPHGIAYNYESFKALDNVRKKTLSWACDGDGDDDECGEYEGTPGDPTPLLKEALKALKAKK